MIEIHNLTKKFDDITAVNSFSCTLKEGIYGLVGQNGAGKSTLLRMIANVILPDEGEILIDSLPCCKEESKKSLFFLPDNPFYPSHGTIKETYDFYSTFYTLDKAKFDSLIEQYKLPLKTKVSTFSKGMKRQLFLVVALSIECRYLLLDEAFDGLDPLVLASIRDELLKKKEAGTLILASSHNIESLDKIADHFLIISQGKLAKEGESEELGNDLVKYQAFFEGDVSKDDLVQLGIKVVTFNKTGSITNFVVQNDSGLEEVLRSHFQVKLLEVIPMTTEEIVTLEMLIAKGGEQA